MTTTTIATVHYARVRTAGIEDMEDRLRNIVELDDGTKVTGVKTMNATELRALGIYPYPAQHGLTFDPETQSVGKALSFDGEKINVMYQVFDNQRPSDDEDDGMHFPAPGEVE